MEYPVGYVVNGFCFIMALARDDGLNDNYVYTPHWSWDTRRNASLLARVHTGPLRHLVAIG